MEQFVFDQLSFLRQVTIHTVKDLNEQQAAVIPDGFNNNILWNLGHIYLAQEQFAFCFNPALMEIPTGFAEMFGMGTKPADWTVQPPSLTELINLLNEQPNRIREKLNNRLNEEIVTPFNIPGINFRAISELLTFNLYHEGIHVQAIRMLKKLINISR